jgi:hypothetical protein
MFFVVFFFYLFFLEVRKEKREATVKKFKFGILKKFKKNLISKLPFYMIKRKMN